VKWCSELPVHHANVIEDGDEAQQTFVEAGRVYRARNVAPRQPRKSSSHPHHVHRVNEEQVMISLDEHTPQSSMAEFIPDPPEGVDHSIILIFKKKKKKFMKIVVHRLLTADVDVEHKPVRAHEFVHDGHPLDDPSDSQLNDATSSTISGPGETTQPWELPRSSSDLNLNSDSSAEDVFAAIPKGMGIHDSGGTINHVTSQSLG
jgi:hypothetical protein